MVEYWESAHVQAMLETDPQKFAAKLNHATAVLHALCLKAILCLNTRKTEYASKIC